MNNQHSTIAGQNHVALLMPKMPQSPTESRLLPAHRHLFILLVLVLFGFTGMAAQLATPKYTYRPGGQLLTDNGVDQYLTFILDISGLDPAAERWQTRYSTNEGVSWQLVNNVHTPSTTFEVCRVPQATATWYQARAFNTVGATSDWSSIVKVWGEMMPRTLKARVETTNLVTLAFNEVNISETGFLVQRATNSGFVGALKTIHAPRGTNTIPGSKMDLTLTDSGFERDRVYYYRAFATNQIYATEPSSPTFVSPCAAPATAMFYDVHNGLSGVEINWQPGKGVVDAWYVQASVGGTNSWSTLSTFPGTAAKYSFVDKKQSPGSICYYRVLASNQVDVLPSATANVVIPRAIIGTVWYVDANARGTGDGTTWANAWPNFASVAWGNVKPGSTVWIAKGTYPEIAYCRGFDGTSNAPITFKVAQDPLHAGKVYLDGVDIRRKYIHWDGAISDAYVPPSTEAITNNINLVLGSTNSFHGVYVELSSGQGIVLKWIECRKVQNPEWINVNMGIFGEGLTSGITYKGGAPHRDNEIAYIWVHDLEGSGVDVSMFNATGWGPVEVHHCLVERVRANCLTGSSGDYHDNILRDEWRPVAESPPGVHPDGAQMWMPYLRMWNNVIRNTTGQALYVTLSFTNNLGCLIYNNIIYSTGGTTWTNKDGSVGVKDINAGIQFTTSHDNVAGIWDYMSVSNVLIANNTFYGFNTAYVDVARRENQTLSLRLRNWVVANNLFYDANAGSQQNIGKHDYSPADVVFDWNNVCGANSAVGYGATANDGSLAALAAATGFKRNISYTPTLVNVAYRAGRERAYDFHLTAADALQCIGTNLSGWESIAPQISRSQDGRARAPGAWPIGALGLGSGSGRPLRPTGLRLASGL